MATWQPIETAPKTGAQIWAWASGPDEWMDGETIHWQGVIYWNDMLLMGMPEDWAGLPNKNMQPTHWMPLPAPPVIIGR